MIPSKSFVVTSFVFFIFSQVSVVSSTGAQCKDHPLYKTGMKGEIIRSWMYKPNPDGSMYWTRSKYFPRYKQHAWIPINNSASTKYSNLDYFTTNHRTNSSIHDFVTLYFQRNALVYLLVHSTKSNGNPPSLTDWKPEGFINMSRGTEAESTSIDMGDGTINGQLHAPRTAYVFSRNGTSVSIGSQDWVFNNMRNLDADGSWSALIAESDGSVVLPPERPVIEGVGIEIEAGGRCPDALHDSWVTLSTDTEDAATNTTYFKTWHPLWDPCYWCAYNHEHGSSAPILMGYRPKYGYTALKNNVQQEAHTGFKDFVLGTPKYHIYVGLHALMSSPERFFTRFHTMVIAVVNKSTKELMLELSFKADFGHREVRLANNTGRMPVSLEDEIIRNVTELYGKDRKFRVINVISYPNLDSRYQYKTPVLRGEYEQWRTRPICSAFSRDNEPKFDFKDPAIALRSENSTNTTQHTVLGRSKGDKLLPHVSVNRQFTLQGFTLSARFCMFSLPNIPIHGTKRHKTGKFYTNTYGNALMNGPDDTHIAQYIKPGFNISVTGTFNTMDPWLGLYKDGAVGQMRDIGHALDSGKN